MIKKILLLTILIAAIAFTGTSFAQMVTPPAHGGYADGWGMNPTNWDSYTGSYNSGFTLYDPSGVHSGGAGWIVGWGSPYEYIHYAPITLELWIEMYMIQTYWYTNYQWHRLGNAAEHITFTIDGTVSSNEGCWILCTKDDGEDGDHLMFQGNIGVGDDRDVRDIPITWRGRWGNGHAIGNNIVLNWIPLAWNLTNELILAEITASDRWFQFEGQFDILYHEPDGYYKLSLSGCPAPSL